MKYSGFLLLIIIAAACKNSSSEDNNTPENISITPPAVTTVANDSVKQQTVQQSQTNTSASAMAIQPTTPVINTAAGLNPEHGKPGHRCDIAVGAPLNSKPTQPVANTNSQPVVNQTPTIVSNPQSVVTKQSSVAPGMNPEHGKPGHRCDIAVGAPLNSKPAAVQPAQNIQTTTSPDAASIPQPTPLQPTRPPAPMVAGLNPEHGKPGHRCDIAVGAPLNSKPANN